MPKFPEGECQNQDLVGECFSYALPLDPDIFLRFVPGASVLCNGTQGANGKPLYAVLSQQWIQLTAGSTGYYSHEMSCGDFLLSKLPTK